MPYVERLSTLRSITLAIVVTAFLIVSAAPAHAQSTDPSKRTQVVFMQQDKVVTFDVTPPNADQPLGGAVGAWVGTATGAVKGTSQTNFKITFTSNPFVRPLTYNFDNRVGITDVDGDQIIFRFIGTGSFNPPLLDPTLPVNNSPFQVFGTAAAPASGGPLTGTYEIVATSGKFGAAPIGQTYSVRAVFFNPATPPTPPGTTGSVSVEVLK